MKSLLLKKKLNIDNQSIMLHKQELLDYLNGNTNKLITIEVDLTLACSHHCPNCTYAGIVGGQKSLSDSIIDKILAGIPEIGAKGMIITGGGEPCFHKKLGGFVKLVNKLGVDVTLTTNGQLVNLHFEDLMHNLKRIRFSIDAASPEVFKYTHGVNDNVFFQVIDNLKKAIEYKRQNKLSIDIGVSYLICDKNIHEVQSAIEFYKNIGANFIHFKPMQYWDKKENHYYHKRYPQIPDMLSISNSYSGDKFRISISRENYYADKKRSNSYYICHGAHFDMIIGADAKVYTCCHFKYNDKYCYGDLHLESLMQIQNKINSKVTSDCFVDCKMDALNQFIEFAKEHKQEIEYKNRGVEDKDFPLGAKWL